MQNRAVFLDRDGVLNRVLLINGKPHPPASLTQLEVLPGVDEACILLRTAGYLLIVVTNQPDVARGRQTRHNVESINAELQRQLKFDDLFMCLHDDGDNCLCRKPRPGMLIEAAVTHSVDLAHSIMVGDRDLDIEAGRAAGCRTVFIDQGYATRPAPPR